jgi:biotin carboxyl carrier protein
MSEIKVITENKIEYKVDVNNDELGLLNDVEFNWDVEQVDANTYHIIKNHKSYTLEVLNIDVPEKLFFVKVNGSKYKFTVKDKFDELLHSLGMDNLTSSKISDLKAPMPGLVLEVSVSEGQEVSKGDALLILEAMKMENVIKSPTDGIVKSVGVSKGDTVEKNELLLSFE